MNQSPDDYALLVSKLEESEQRRRNTIAQAPVAMFVFRGAAMVIEAANEKALEMIRRTDAVVGKPLLEAVPELTGSPAYQVFQQVYQTGIAQYGQEVLVPLERNGKLEERYFNFAYTPLIESGQVVGIMDVATEVTGQVTARKQVEAREAQLRNAIEVAELGTWTIDLLTSQVHLSNRHAEMFGLSSLTMTLDECLSVVHPDDRNRVGAAFAEATNPASDGRFDAEYRIINARNGKQQIVHAKGRASFDENNLPTAIEGVARDITLQRELQLALEGEVRSRTEELATAVEALQITNESLADSNRQLQRSNEELAQYAYVASHDLQEPLRKIRVFTGMLNSDQDRDLVIDKIMSAAERMSLLIQDLLAFSRMLKPDSIMEIVPLRQTILEIWSDFELLAEERGATIALHDLPVIEAVALQMNQLFYNLISNALKFVKPDVPPALSISAKPVSQEYVAKHVARPLTFATYYEIAVADNGIGFEPRYKEQIFEVFKRLHSADRFAGSGIGLPLCRRIVANHNGYLWADATPGKGSTFNILLPDRQAETS